MVRVPSMTNFGRPEAPKELPPIQEPPTQGSPEAIRQNLVPAKEAAGEYTEPKEAAPVPQQNKNLDVLQSAYDKANSAYQKAFEAREAYRASMDQGVEPPAAVQKAFDKAEKALEEAQFHYETALNNEKPQVDEAQNIRQQLVPAKEAAGAYEPEKAPENVKKPGEVAPERVAPPVTMNRETEPEPMPVIRGGVHELPGGGTMGKPLQLKGEVPTEGPGQAEADELRARMVPAKEAAGAYEEPKEVGMGRTLGQVKKIGDLTQEGLGGKALEPNKPIRAQGEILSPEKPQQTQAQKAWETALKDMGQEETGAEKEVQGEPKLSSRPDKAALQKAGAGPEAMDKLLKLNQVELRQLAINAGEDMGQTMIGRGKNSGNIPREQVFERLLKNNTPEELEKMVDEGKHLPPVSGGSQSATLELPKPNTKEAADLDNDLFQRAKEALGPDASVSAVAQAAQAMKKEIYSGPERRATPRTAPLGAKELEEAIKQRKNPNTPFDVTEGASKTIAADKNIPEAPKSHIANMVDAANKAEGREPVDWSKPKELSKDTSRIADAYDEAKHDPDNPEVKKSYDALISDVKKQWNYIQKKMGINIEPQEEDPYKQLRGDEAGRREEQKIESVYGWK